MYERARLGQINTGTPSRLVFNNKIIIMDELPANTQRAQMTLKYHRWKRPIFPKTFIFSKIFNVMKEFNFFIKGELKTKFIFSRKLDMSYIGIT